MGNLTVAPHADGTTVSTTSELSYFLRLATSERFGTLATAELHRRGLEHAEQAARW